MYAHDETERHNLTNRAGNTEFRQCWILKLGYGFNQKYNSVECVPNDKCKSYVPNFTDWSLEGITVQLKLSSTVNESGWSQTNRG